MDVAHPQSLTHPSYWFVLGGCHCHDRPCSGITPGIHAGEPTHDNDPTRSGMSRLSSRHAGLRIRERHLIRVTGGARHITTATHTEPPRSAWCERVVIPRPPRVIAP